MRKIKPIVPAISEAIRIAIFELFTMSALSNTRSVMKIDIVKPIPPKKPAPIIFQIVIIFSRKTNTSRLIFLAHGCNHS